MNFNDIARYTETEDKAREFLERQRWPNGAICPHCGVEGESYHLKPKKGSKSPVRPGVWKCGGCRKQFTVKVGTIFEDSHIPLTTWLKAIHLLCASKKGMSAHQLHRMLGVTYKSAWFMAHRIRYAMTQEPLSSKLSGEIEIDETYVGGKLRIGPMSVKPGERPKDRLVGTANKAIVLSVLQRGGRVQSRHIDKVTAQNLRPIIDQAETSPLSQGLQYNIPCSFFQCRVCRGVMRPEGLKPPTFSDNESMKRQGLEQVIKNTPILKDMLDIVRGRGALKVDDFYAETALRLGGKSDGFTTGTAILIEILTLSGGVKIADNTLRPSKSEAAEQTQEVEKENNLIQHKSVGSGLKRIPIAVSTNAVWWIEVGESPKPEEIQKFLEMQKLMFG